ncbi:MAG: alpha-L-rhamnosidase N-terminal domain-containing protein [Bacteroidaceae bacterium]|nr:alpha-L-rhamnosidase N-terminal domain-containing protein [Bacteroidaceae bacterium]
MKKSIILFLLTLACNICTATSDANDGKWICAAECTHSENTWQIFRKKIVLDKKPDKAQARIAADSKYWLWINGNLAVFEGSLKRGPAPGDHYCDIVDISKYLKKGENCIAVLTWFFGKGGFSHHNSGKGGFYFKATIEGQTIKSDDSWKAALYSAYKNTEAPHPNFRLPESNIRFDAREEKEGWQVPDFNDSFMTQATIIAEAGDSPFGKAVERPIPLWKDYGLKKYAATRTSQSGDTLFCRLPYNCHATPYLKVKAEAGKTIHIITDNYRGGSDNNVRAEYITREGVQEYESYGWMNGHEIFYIVPEGVKILEVKYRETGYDTEFSGSFHSDDPFLNELWKRSARTLYVTMRDTYMDCPDRERAQWWGDEVNELGETFYALSPSAHKLAAKGIRELINWQRKDGVIFSPMPATTWNKELPLQMLASVGWYGFYTHYFYSGDSSFVAEIYDGLHRYLHEVWQTDGDGIAIVRHGDWSWGDWGSNIDLQVLTSCWYYLALKAEKEFAQMLGKREDAAQCEQMMKKMKSSFDKRFWNGAAYRSPNYKRATDDRAQAMAIVSGLAGREKYPALTKILAEEYHASPYMEKYVLEALCIMGEEKFAIDRMKNRYKRMLGYNYTTLFEGWGIGSDGFGGGTINHAWSGGPLTILSQKICGISPTSSAFRTFRVAPQMGSLNEASASLETIYGKIEVSLKRKNGNIKLKIKVPEKTSAEIQMADGSTKRVSAGTHKITL